MGRRVSERQIRRKGQRFRYRHTSRALSINICYNKAFGSLSLSGELGHARFHQVAGSDRHGRAGLGSLEHPHSPVHLVRPRRALRRAGRSGLYRRPSPHVRPGCVVGVVLLSASRPFPAIQSGEPDASERRGDRRRDEQAVCEDGDGRRCRQQALRRRRQRQAEWRRRQRYIAGRRGERHADRRQRQRLARGRFGRRSLCGGFPARPSPGDGEWRPRHGRGAGERIHACIGNRESHPRQRGSPREKATRSPT